MSEPKDPNFTTEELLEYCEVIFDNDLKAMKKCYAHRTIIARTRNDQRQVKLFCVALKKINEILTGGN